MVIKLLILDFDGTIADTKALYYNSIYKRLKEEGAHISIAQLHKELLGIKLEAILKKLKIKKDVGKIKSNVHADVFNDIKRIRISKDAKYIKQIEVEKIIVSNTITKHILPVLRHNKINYFKEVYGGDKFENKESFIKKYMKKNNLNKNEVVYVGDMVADIKVARKAGCIGVSISHNISWNSRKELLKAHPNFMITSLKELDKILK